MDKKKKIIIISIVSVVLLGAIVAGVGYKNKENPKEIGSTSNSQGENMDRANTQSPDIEWDPNSEPEPSKGNGCNLNDFSKEIKKLGYIQLPEEESYDCFENEESIINFQIEENGVKASLNNKENISNEAVKSAIALLIPNEMESLITTINECTTEIATSLDNRTVSIIVTDNELELFISN